MRISMLLLIISLAVGSSAIARAGEAAMTLPAGQPVNSTVVSLDGDGWLLATDPMNVGREQKWIGAPQAEAKPTKMPWIIQDAFPGYHGVAWYWREFAAPANPHAGGRYLLRFWAVDYLAEVWLNGGLTLAEYRLGSGRFFLNTLPIREQLSTNSVAERLLRNLLRHAASEAAQPVADLPADFDKQLKAIGY